MKRGAAFIFLMVVGGIAAPVLTHFEFDFQDLDRVLLAPNGVNWFGTDSLGRDLFSRVLYGARVSMAIGICTSLASLIIGVAIGGVAGYRGGLIDLIILRLIDVFQSIPTLVMMTLVMMIFSSRTFFESDHLTRLIAIILSLSLVSWINVARVVRTQVMQMKALTFVEAARSAGGSGMGIFMNHILRNIWGPIAVLLAYQVPSNILFESFLSFIGLGLQPPYSSWGVLANEGWRSLRSYPHLILFPGIFLFLTTYSFNAVADGLRDRFDPKFR